MNTKRLGIIAAAVAFLAVGCSRPDATMPVKGEIFITLNDRQTIKMSLVDVLIFPPEVIAHQIDAAEAAAHAATQNAITKASAYLDKLKSVETRASRVLLEISSLRLKAEEMKARADLIKAAVRTPLNQLQLQAVDGHAGALVREVENASARGLEQRSAAEALTLEMLSTTSEGSAVTEQALEAVFACSMFDLRMPKPLLQTTTDADGRFSFAAVAKGTNYFAFAKASRINGEETERFVWMQQIPTNGSPIAMHTANVHPGFLEEKTRLLTILVRQIVDSEKRILSLRSELNVAVLR